MYCHPGFKRSDVWCVLLRTAMPRFSQGRHVNWKICVGAKSLCSTASNSHKIASTKNLSSFTINIRRARRNPTIPTATAPNPQSHSFHQRSHPLSPDREITLNHHRYARSNHQKDSNRPPWANSCKNARTLRNHSMCPVAGRRTSTLRGGSSPRSRPMRCCGSIGIMG